MTGRPQLPRLMPVDHLNRASPIEFAAALTPLFETAPPLAELLYHRTPFASYGDLIGQAEAVALTLPTATQIEVLNAHPRIGANQANLSVLSRHEQGLAGDSSAEPTEVHAELVRLNDTYEAQFGFRFVVFVNGRSRTEILEVLRARLAQPPEQELRTALKAMFLIARHRLSILDPR